MLEFSGEAWEAERRVLATILGYACDVTFDDENGQGEKAESVTFAGVRYVENSPRLIFQGAPRTAPLCLDRDRITQIYVY